MENLESKIISCRVLTLSNILEDMAYKCYRYSSDAGHKIPSFLRHFTTLITRTDPSDEEAKEEIAVTGSIEADQMKLLVVSQNFSGPSLDEGLNCRRITRSTKSFNDIVNNYQNPERLQEHIEDVSTALSLCNPNDTKQIRSLRLFILRRCYPAIRARFYSDKKLFRGRQLHHLLKEWDGGTDGRFPKWVEVHDWEVSSFPDHPCMKKRTVTRHGRDIVEWEYSSDTRVAWAWILSEILRLLDEAFCHVDEVRFKDNRQGSSVTAEEQQTAYERLHESLIRLRSCFVGGRRGIFEDLFYDADLRNKMRSASKQAEWEEFDEESDQEIDEGIDECDEVYLGRITEIDIRTTKRTFPTCLADFLRSTAAWYSAVKKLSMKLSRFKARENLVIGLMELPGLYQVPAPLTLEEFKSTYSRKRPFHTPPEHFDILEQVWPPTLHVTLHPEAVLMCLFLFGSSQQHRTIHDGTARNANWLQDILDSVTIDKIIALERKCCLCCDALRKALNWDGFSVTLPDSHGGVVAWALPRIRMKVSVLERLEPDLWRNLESALTEKSMKEGVIGDVFMSFPLTFKALTDEIQQQNAVAVVWNI